MWMCVSKRDVLAAGEVSSVDFDATGKLIATGCRDGKLRVIEADADKPDTLGRYLSFVKKEVVDI